jgi:very-short-patch-repair endonuclease
VKHVVDLMLEHAAAEAASELPRSIGVIAFGVKHAARIEREFEERLETAPLEVQEYFRDEGRERYFIKNIERVQGDERDVIILTVGYGRGTNGKLSYSWGPVLTEGGFRRVNVAITRARSQMIVVTSFAPEDVDKQASTSEGFQLMYRFLHFAGSSGTDFGDEGPMDVPVNVFEADIQQRMEGRGLKVVPQYGVGGYRLDFAVQHPDNPARYLLAVEADGASYHSGFVARERDRLRQRQLEARGWRFVRIWSSDYFFDPEAQIDRVLAAYEEELAASSPKKRLRRHVQASPSIAADDDPLTTPPTWTEGISARHGWPGVRRGLKIQDYTDTELQRVVIWVLSDERPRTRSEVFEEAKAELGFQRSGKVISERLTLAVNRVMSTVQS